MNALKPRQLLVTGCTGFLGSHLLLELLKREPNCQIHCLVRPRSAVDPLAPEARLLEHVNTALCDSGFTPHEAQAEIGKLRGRIHVLAGGLPDSELGQKLAHLRFDEVWHVAGLMHFAERHRAAVHEANVQGTRSLLSVLEGCSVASFNYVSTAYVAGHRHGPIAEAPVSDGSPVNNSYEESKRFAEQAVIEACARQGVRCRIFRPAIVVGHSRTFRADSNVGLYGFLALLERARDEVEGRIPDYFSQHSLKLLAAADASMNFICVDRAVELMVRVAQSPSTDRYFHVASARATPFSLLCELWSEITGLRVRLVTRAEELNPIDNALRARSKDFQGYLGPHKDFSLTATLAASGADPEITLIDRERCRRLMAEFAQRHRKQQAERKTSAGSVLKRLERRLLHDDRAEPLRYFVGGSGAETVLILNAYGQSPAFWNWLVERWLPRHRVIVVQPRGTEADLDSAGTFKLEQQVDDLGRVLDAEVTGPCHLVAWCTGPKVALKLAAQRPGRLSSLSLITGAFRGFVGTEQLGTSYEENMEPLCRMVVADPTRAQLVMEALRALMAGEQKHASSERVHVSELLSLVSNSLKPLVVAPFLRESSVVNYAHQLLDFWSRDLSQELAQVATPTLFIAAEKDRIASASISEVVAKRTPGAAFVNIRGGTHYCMHDNAELVGDLIETSWRDPRQLAGYADDVTFSA